MSDNKVEVEFGGQVAPSYQSSTQKVREGLKAVKQEYDDTADASTAAASKAAAAHSAWELGMRAVQAVGKRIMREIAKDFSPAALEMVGVLFTILTAIKAVNATMFLMEKATGAAERGLKALSFNEDLAKKLQPLTGTLDAAKGKLKELASEAAKAGVALPDAVEIHRTTAPVTGGQFSDSEGLTRLGDLATSSGQKITDVAAAVTALYADLQTGRPIQQSADHLRDMGVISQETRESLDALLTEGKSGAEVWNTLNGKFEESAGAMEAARDNLGDLQKALLATKERLYEVFARDYKPSGDGGEEERQKDALKEQIDLYKKLEPAAEETGSVFNAVRGRVIELAEAGGLLGKIFTPLAERLGYVSDAADKGGKSSTGWYNAILDRAGDLRKWVDLILAGGAALLAFGVALPFGAILAGGVAVGAAFAAVVAAVVAATAGVFIYTARLNAATAAQMALIAETDGIVASLRKQEAGIKSVTDKLAALAAAYGALKVAQDALGNAKTPEARQELQTRVDAIRREIAREEKVDDNTLKASDPRAANENQTRDAEFKQAKEAQSPRQQLDALGAYLDEAVAKRGQLFGEYEKAQQDFSPGRRADLDRQSADARGDAATAKTPEERTAALATAAAIEATRAGLSQRVETTRTALSAQDAEVANRRGPYLTLKRQVETDDRTRQEKLAELEIERRQAGLQTEGIVKTREEWAMRRGLLQTELATSQANHDARDADKEAVRQAELRNKIAQGDATLAKEEKALREQLRDLAVETAVATLESQGARHAQEEYALRRGLLETRLRESEAASDVLKVEQARAALLKLQADHVRENIREARDERDGGKGLEDQKAERAEANQKRLLDRRLVEGKITEKQHRDGEVALLERQRRRLLEEAGFKNDDAREATDAGDKAGARRLRKEEEAIRARADALGGQEYDLLHPKPQRRSPIADELQKIGGGGSAYYGTGKDPTEAKLDDIKAALKEGNRLLQQVGQKIDKQRVL